MRFFLDTEFIEDGRTIDLLSIALVADSGAEFYAELAETDRGRAHPWVQEHVIPKLTGPVLPRDAIAWDIVCFVRQQHGHPEQGPRPEFWGYYADYDWVALCQLFGRMLDLPKGFPMFCLDLKQWAHQLGNPQPPEQGKGEHHALADARWNRDVYRFLATHPLHPDAPHPERGKL